MPESEPAPAPPITLDAALAQLDEYLRYLSGGASFCDDRGFGWTVESEGWRREHIANLFTRVAELRTLLPVMVSRLQANEKIADHEPSLKEFNAVFAHRRAVS